jgi:hypothetical protein
MQKKKVNTFIPRKGKQKNNSIYILLACSDVALLLASLAKTARDFWPLSPVNCISEPTIVPSYSQMVSSNDFVP